MNGETLYRETSYLRAFPDPAEVFAEKVAEHSEYLLPVATVSLEHLGYRSGGLLHFIVPIEPCAGYGYTGDNSGPYHTYLCRPNWIGYKVLGDKCVVACDFRYFHKAQFAARPPSAAEQDEAAGINDHYAEARLDFHDVVESFRAGTAVGASGAADFALVRNLGGESPLSNEFGFPVSRYPCRAEDQGGTYEFVRLVPRTEDGRDFRFVGSVEMWNYFKGHNGILHLFFDPPGSIALTTIDWT